MSLVGMISLGHGKFVIMVNSSRGVYKSPAWLGQG